MPRLVCLIPLIVFSLSTIVMGAEEPAAVSVASTLPEGSHTEGGMLHPFYGEVIHNNRIYLFGKKAAYKHFLDSKEANPLTSKILIGKGPNRMTVVVQVDKEVPVMTNRLIAQMRTRHSMP